VRGDEFSLWWRVTIPLLLPLVRILFRVRSDGWEHVPSTGPVIIVFNHVSVLDGPALGLETVWHVRRRMRFLVAGELFNRRVVGFILRRYDQIPIHRGTGDRGALDEAIATIRDGAVAALAPEGRVDERGGAEGLQRIRRGIARIALPTAAPIVPIGIWGTQFRWPRTGPNFGRPFRPRLGLAVGPPLLPVGDPSADEEVAALLERVRAALDEQVARARRLAGVTT
jgi:1-acyl-sn-glycerol-3-phosphate acyltransferase